MQSTSKNKITDDQLDVIQMGLQKLSINQKENVDPLRITDTIPLISKKKFVAQGRPQIEDPSYYREFVECSSLYQVPLKEDSEEISDGEEFHDARHLQIYDQDATEVFMIEKENQWRNERSGGFGLPQNTIRKQASELREQGTKSRRAKGYKHFKEVGFQGSNNASVPRWAVNDELLKNIKNHQQKIMNPVKIFGKWGPGVVKQHFNEAQIFKKGTNPD